MNRQIYRSQVALLLRIMPCVYKLEDFAVHGGTAINLFHSNMPRYSVDIDLTYIPIEDRGTSLAAINAHLLQLKKDIERVVPGIKITHKPEVLKLLCMHQGATVKIEVNNIKRGIIENCVTLSLCEAAQQDFATTCKIRSVGYSQLYGGKLAAALSRQHPRDMFDFAHMKDKSFDLIRDGLLFNLASSDKPIVESLFPNPIDQTEALERQFAGMSEMPYSYSDYEQTRSELQQFVLQGLSHDDKAFLLSIEQGAPNWDVCSGGDWSHYPSIQWKQHNIHKLQKQNPAKYEQMMENLKSQLAL